MKETTRARAKLSGKDVLDLRLESGCAEGTVRAWAKGAKVKPVTLRRLGRAAAKLGIAVNA